MCFMYNKLAESFPPSFPASFVRKELGKPVFLLLFSEVGSIPHATLRPKKKGKSNAPEAVGQQAQFYIVGGSIHWYKLYVGQLGSYQSKLQMYTPSDPATSCLVYR